jgi:Flp pilus assembly protein TadG
MIAGRQNHNRRGVILVLVAILLVIFMGMTAFSIDIGYVATVKAQLQRSADGAALAAAAEMNKVGISAARARGKQIGQMNYSSAESISIPDSNIVFGIWDLDAKTFTPSSTGNGCNAVKVTIQQTPKTAFAGVLGIGSMTAKAESIAIANPRDICFVVDLSGSMNDDTDPCWATTAINNKLGSTVGNTIMQDVYTDFNLGTFPGTNQHIGHPLGSSYQNLSGSASTNAYANMTANSGPLASTSIPTAYRISSSDSETTRKTKAYKYIIDYQLAVLIPNAKPTPNSTSNYTFWERYLDYIIIRSSPSGRGTVPPNVDTNAELVDFNNPNTANYPGVSGPSAYRNYVGPRTYVQFQMDYGRDEKVNGANVALSKDSPLCPMHSESTDGGTFQFPPREMPTHACRRSIIAALEIIRQNNSLNPSSEQKDWVSVVTFDKNASGTIAQTLTSDYTAVMQACTRLQAVSDVGASTATEAGLITAQSHLKDTSSGGSGRIFADKLIVLLTDGQPNIVSSSNATISSYRTSNPSSYWFGGSNYTKDGPLMQAMMAQKKGWKTHAVGIGFGTDYTFMDRLASTGKTADANGQSPRNTGDPAQYEQKLKQIFQDIIANTGVRLVQ